ncbi:hypothetical protein [Burkholderia glumae]|uniref:hypothetical protein n=1 Tax=Burkholderia glumae TaxID=337 RepID=UPI0020375DDF|nr:hypothetical protein [Burkholderia glumae]MCM2550490.1 hypothetical protein [Burkholderia glumae]
MTTSAIEIEIPVDAAPLLTALDKLLCSISEHPELAPMLREDACGRERRIDARIFGNPRPA